MIPFKDVPLKAVPFVIFLVPCVVFGEMIVRMPAHPNTPQLLVDWAATIFVIISGVLFFTKIFVNWPNIPGLQIEDV